MNIEIIRDALFPDLARVYVHDDNDHPVCVEVVSRGRAKTLAAQLTLGSEALLEFSEADTNE